MYMKNLKIKKQNSSYIDPQYLGAPPTIIKVMNTIIGMNKLSQHLRNTN
jgi:hypothetical protein